MPQPIVACAEFTQIDLMQMKTAAQQLYDTHHVLAMVIGEARGEADRGELDPEGAQDDAAMIKLLASYHRLTMHLLAAVQLSEQSLSSATESLSLVTRKTKLV